MKLKIYEINYDSDSFYLRECVVADTLRECVDVINLGSEPNSLYYAEIQLSSVDDNPIRTKIYPRMESIGVLTGLVEELNDLAKRLDPVKQPRLVWQASLFRVNIGPQDRVDCIHAFTFEAPLNIANYMPIVKQDPPDIIYFIKFISPEGQVGYSRCANTLQPIFEWLRGYTDEIPSPCEEIREQQKMHEDIKYRARGLNKRIADISIEVKRFMEVLDKNL
jgi:hypothetical protein